ncbi:unnamed protein product [Meganyctiphanes norvegica]|uniref:Sema domain-containing protein n=1 Tax=Meganyctiphanes norvegica TaxID=48144 RepID=A0AAV2SBZ2_MEGNR
MKQTDNLQRGSQSPTQDTTMENCLHQRGNRSRRSLLRSGYKIGSNSTSISSMLGNDTVDSPTGSTAYSCTTLRTLQCASDVRTDSECRVHRNQLNSVKHNKTYNASMKLPSMSSRMGLTMYSSILMVFVALSMIVPTTLALTASAFSSELRPNSIVRRESLTVHRFLGNTSHVDFFRLLERDGDSLIVGARNIVYNISIHDLEEYEDQRIEWRSKDQDSITCYSKGKSESDCQNFIRVFAKQDDGNLLVCGTNAYKPLCRTYTTKNEVKKYIEESSAVGKCPFDPKHNSTFVYTDGKLYSGTVGDFQAMTPLINRDQLRTDHNDYKQLNNPDFVSSFSYGSWVWFLFRETATEYMNCGKRVYSRVGRVCKSDSGGGSSRLSSSWTSFLKARLNCSVPGHFPFYFDEIQSTSDIISGTYGEKQHELLYAVFTTPQNSIPGSAICAFSMRHILDAFEGDFKEQETPDSNWLPVRQNKIPSPRPSICANNSKNIPDNTVNFVKIHPLMDEAVPTFFGRPLIMKATFDYRFTKLVVDPQVALVNGETVDVFFIATDNGIILKAINKMSSISTSKVGGVIVEEIHVSKRPIINLELAKQPGAHSKLIIITDDDIQSIDLHRCYNKRTCSSCVRLQDPYCGWSEGEGRCSYIDPKMKGPLLQNITSGEHPDCPYSYEDDYYKYPSTQIYQGAGRQAVEVTTPKPLPDLRVTEERPEGSQSTKPITTIEPLPTISTDCLGPVVGESIYGGSGLSYPAETLAVAVTVSCVAALVVGFISGFLVSRKCKTEDEVNPDVSYLDSKINRHGNAPPAADPNMYTSNNNQINNLVTTFNPKNTNSKTTNTTANSSLLKPSKCAYI